MKKNLVVFHLFLTLLAITQVCSADPDNVKQVIVDYDCHDQSHELSSAVSKAKDKVAETTHTEIDLKRDIAHKTADRAREAVDEIKKIAREIKEAVEYSYEKNTKESIKDIGKTLVGDISRNTSKLTGNVASKVKGKAHQLFDGMSQSAKNTVKYMISPEAFDDFMVLLNLVGFAMAYGMLMWVTFVSGYVLERVLPRQQFGLVQSRIYPVYFRVLICCIIATLLGHVYGRRVGIFTDKSAIFQAYNLIASILMVFVNLMILEPRVSMGMFERLKVEKEGADLSEDGRVMVPDVTVADGVSDDNNNMRNDATTRDPPERSTEQQEAVRSRILRNERRMKWLNSFSSILNMSTFMALSWHLVYLGQRLRL